MQTDAGTARISGTKEIVLVTGHSHPQAFGPPNDPNTPDAISAQVNAVNEGISQNPNDTVLSNMAPLVLKTPSSVVKVFRNGVEE